MARDDWRIRIELPEEEGAAGFLGRLGLDLGSEARVLAGELREQRLAVSRDDDVVFVYASSLHDAEQAQRVVAAELAEAQVEPRLVRVEHWLQEKERWDDEPAGPTSEEETLAEGHSPWEVRVECGSHGEAHDLADRLEGEGYGVARRWRYLIVGASSRPEADELAQRLHGEVEPSPEAVWEVVPQNPFAIFGGLGGAGTPL